MKIGEETSITVKFQPENATNKGFRVEGTDSKIATSSITGNVIRFTGVSPGTFTCKVITDDGDFEASISVTVKEATPAGRKRSKAE